MCVCIIVRGYVLEDTSLMRDAGETITIACSRIYELQVHISSRV